MTTLAPTATTGLTVADLQGSARRRRKETAVRAAFQLAAFVTVLVSVLIVVSLARETWSFISQVPLGSLSDIGWFPRRGLFDIRTLVVGSLLVTAVAMVVAVPLGFGAAIYLAEYARPGVRKMLKPVLEVLAGVPSVVLGFFALAWISPEIVQRFFTDAQRLNMAAAGIAVGILTVPLIASVAEDALQSVPDSLREGSAAMGARKVTTTIRVVVPAAISGLVAATIVGLSRAIGETMVVALAAGATGGSIFSWDVTQPGQTMTAAMASMAAGTDQVKGDNLAFQSLFFVGSLLFLITLSLNVVAGRFVRRVRRAY